MFSKKQNSQTNKSDVSRKYRNIRSVEGLLTAYKRGERNFNQVNLEKADLSNLNLTGISLKQANLKGANLSQAILSKANLEEANLEKADFQNADLTEANLRNANLEEAKLDAANLTSAILIKANLSYAYMASCQLIEANLKQAHLVGADLTAANLKKSILDKANLKQVRLRKANLEQASLIEVYLKRVKLQFANLTEANLQKASLDETEFNDAILTRTDLRGIDISQIRWTNLELAIVGELETPIKEHLHLELTNSIPSFTFSSDGEMLAYLNRDEKIIIVNPNSGEQINEIDIQLEPVVSVAFSDDGEHLHESYYINDLKLWNPATGELIKRLKNHPANVTAIVLNNNKKEISFKGTGGDFEEFNIASQIRTIKGYSTGILVQTHSPDEKLTAKSKPDLDGQIEIIERQTGRQICLLTGNKAPVQSLTFSPDSQTLVSKSAKDFKVWDIRTKELIYDCKFSRPSGRKYQPFIGFIQADDSTNPVLISNQFCYEFRTRHVKPLRDGTRKWNSGSSSTSQTADIVLSKNGKRIARYYHGIPVQLWDLQIGEELRTVKLKPLAFNANGSLFAAWYGLKIALIDVKTNKIIFKFVPPLDEIKQVIFSPDDKILAFINDNCKILLWNLETNCEIITFQELASIDSLTFHPTEPILAVGSRDRTIKLWDLETLEEIHSFKSSFTYLKFSSKGILASSDNSDKIRLWKFNRSSS